MMAWMVVVLSVRTNQPVRIEPQVYATEDECREDVTAVEDMDLDREYASCKLIPVPEKKDNERR